MSYYVLVAAPTVDEILRQMNYRAAFDADDPYGDISEEINRSYMCLILQRVPIDPVLWGTFCLRTRLLEVFRAFKVQVKIQ